MANIMVEAPLETELVVKDALNPAKKDSKFVIKLKGGYYQITGTMKKLQMR